MHGANMRAVLARFRPERRQRILEAGAAVLLGAALVAVVTEPERGLALIAQALVAVFLLARPHWGILAIFVLVIFRIDPARVGPFGTSELLAAPLMLPLALEIVRDRRVWAWRVPQIRLLLAIGAMLLVATEWSLLMHPAPPISEQEGPWSTLILFGQQLLFLVYLVYFIKTPRHLTYAVVVVLVMILAAAVDSLDLLGAGHGGERARVSQGWAANSNRLAFLCVWGTALAWSLRFKGPRGWWRPLTLAPLLGLPITTLMTGSRNGLVQLMLLGGLVLLEQRQWSPAQRARAFALMAMAAVMVLALAPAAMMERASNFQETSVTDRLATHRAGALMVAEHPLFGVGPGNFHWRNQVMTGHAMSTHDSYLWAATAAGIPLLALYLALFCRTYRMLRTVERRATAEFVWLATALRFNLFILLAFSFFADLWLSHPFYLMLGLTIVLFRVARGVRAPMADMPAPPRVAAPVWAGR
jgi:O-antigen ligase